MCVLQWPQLHLKCVFSAEFKVICPLSIIRLTFLSLFLVAFSVTFDLCGVSRPTICHLKPNLFSSTFKWAQTKQFGCPFVHPCRLSRWIFRKGIDLFGQGLSTWPMATFLRLLRQRRMMKVPHPNPQMGGLSFRFHLANFWVCHNILSHDCTAPFLFLVGSYKICWRFHYFRLPAFCVKLKSNSQQLLAY